MTNTGASNSPKASLHILIVSDGKPGHLNQSLGLVKALKRACLALGQRQQDQCQQDQRQQVDCQSSRIEFSQHSPISAFENIALAFGRRPKAWPKHCDVVVGAGHSCHLTILAAARYYQATSIVLMKPSLPRSLFDVCIVPKHDGLKEDANTLLTEGALNPVCYQGEQKSLKMILIGGPSKHFQWQEDALIEQLQNIVGAEPASGQEDWLILTSRRTPDSFNKRLSDQAWPLKVVHPDDVPQGWLAEQFPKAAICWVSPDSVSMVYEALTAQAKVALLELPACEPLSRVAKGVQELSRSDYIDNYKPWLERGRGELKVTQEPFNQADKIAQKLLAANVFAWKLHGSLTDA